jgi:3-hydroxyisobutyrate dehydrogenase-like beta-hydroxyacid dehydrogenase
VLELGFAGIHARPLELAGWEVVVMEPDPAQAERARQRGAEPVERAEGRFDVVIAPLGADLAGIDAAKIILVDERGAASMSG